MEASNVVPPLTSPHLDKNVPKKVTGDMLKSNPLENLPKGNDS